MNSPENIKQLLLQDINSLIECPELLPRIPEKILHEPENFRQKNDTFSNWHGKRFHKPGIFKIF